MGLPRCNSHFTLCEYWFMVDTESKEPALDLRNL
jgi:hypothetical protein